MLSLILREGTEVVTLQNGVDAANMVTEIVGGKYVMGGVKRTMDRFFPAAPDCNRDAPAHHAICPCRSIPTFRGE